MKQNDIKIGIQRALLKGSISTPTSGDDQGWAEWVEWMSLYLFEFVKRAIQRGMKLEDAERHAFRAWKMQYRDSVVAALPGPPQNPPIEGDSTNKGATK